MNIEPIDVFSSLTKCIGKYGDKDVLGYWTRFKWENSEGFAFLFPYGRGVVELNKVISVETEQQEIRNFIRVLDSTNCKLKFIVLGTQGDYHVTGKVEVIHRDSDDNSFEVAYIRVGDWSFTVTSDDIDSDELNVGDIVEFDLIGLELFDTGIY